MPRSRRPSSGSVLLSIRQRRGLALVSQQRVENVLRKPPADARGSVIVLRGLDLDELAVGLQSLDGRVQKLLCLDSSTRLTSDQSRLLPGDGPIARL